MGLPTRAKDDPGKVKVRKETNKRTMEAMRDLQLLLFPDFILNLP